MEIWRQELWHRHTRLRGLRHHSGCPPVGQLERQCVESGRHLQFLQLRSHHRRARQTRHLRSRLPSMRGQLELCRRTQLSCNHRHLRRTRVRIYQIIRHFYVVTLHHRCGGPAARSQPHPHPPAGERVLDLLGYPRQSDRSPRHGALRPRQGERLPSGSARPLPCGYTSVHQSRQHLHRLSQSGI